MKFEGKVLICDRCDKHVFLTKKDEKHLDGGYTVIPVYDKEPEGWTHISVDKYKDLCPECSRVWKDVVSNFMNPPALHTQIGTSAVNGYTSKELIEIGKSLAAGLAEGAGYGSDVIEALKSTGQE